MAALCHEHPALGHREVRQQPPRRGRFVGLLEDERADRHGKLEVFAVVSGPVRSHAVLTALADELGMKPEIDERIRVRAGDDEHRAALSAVAAAWASPRDELFAAERQTSVAPVAGDDVDFNFVDEHQGTERLELGNWIIW